MNKRLKLVVLSILVLVMSTSLLYGCGSQSVASSSQSAVSTSAASPSAVSAAATSTAPAATTASINPNSEVYTMANRIPWSGVFSPTVTSRDNIDKAINASNKKDKVTVGYATWTLGTPFFAAMKDTIKTECEKYGYTLITAVSDADVNKQIGNIESFVTMHVDIIIDNALSVEAEAVAVKAAVNAGIPVIGLGLPFADSTPVITTTATNNYEAGFLVGKLAATQFKDKAIKAATIPGMIGHTISESKLNGFLGGVVYERAIQMGKPFATREDAMLYGYKLEQQIVKNAKFSDATYKFEVVASVDGAWSQDGGMKAMEDIATGHQDINFVFTDNDQEAIGASKALTQIGMKLGSDIFLCCVGDGTKEALQMVKDGKILGLTLDSPYTWAGACTQLAYKIFHDGFDATNLPASSYLPDILCTKDNVDTYMPTQDFTTLPNQVFTPIVSK